MVRLLNRLRSVFTIERLVWIAVTVVVAAFAFFLGMDVPFSVDSDRIVVVEHPESGEIIPTYTPLKEYISTATTTPERDDTPDGTKTVLELLNTATKSDFTAITGIGDKIADNILAYRDKIRGFHRIEELKNVPLVGDKRYETIVKWFENLAKTY